MSAPENIGVDGPTLESVSLPDEVEGFTKRRVELVQRAVREWMAALIDLGGRNNLLRYRDLKAGTLDLSNAAPGAIAGLLQGKAIKTSALFSDPDEQERGVRRLRTISSKAKENFEERGLETLSLACGLATWNNENVAGWEPLAPVLLRQASLRPLGAARDDFELVLVDEMEVNPTLLHFLKVNFDCDLDQDSLNDRLDGAIDEPWELDETYRWMVERASRVPGIAVEPRLVLANFAYAKLPMVNDLERSFDELVAHDLIAAIAGDEEARQSVRAAQPGPEAIPTADATALADEFLVLDADSSQNWAINAVLAGESVIIRGPPGTGKSQTISNLIASLIARNKRVLFVAEKRAAIDAVLKRVQSQGLEDLVLDLHGGVGSRRAFAQKIGIALAASRTAPRVDGDAERRRVEKRRDELNVYVRALHEPRPPWGISLYQLRTDLFGLREFGSDLRFDDEVLGWLDRVSLGELEDEMSEYARLGGFTLAASDRPWAHTELANIEQAQQAYELVDNLRRERLPKTVAALKQAAELSGMPMAPTLSSWASRLACWHEVAVTLEHWQPSVYEQDLDSLVERMAPAGAGGFTRIKASLFSADYKQARSQLRAVADTPELSDSELRREAEAALRERAQWDELGGNGMPSIPSDLPGIAALHDALLGDLTELGELTTRVDLADLDEPGVGDVLSAFAEDRGTLMTLPELHRLRTSFAEAGLEAFIADLEGRAASEEVVISTLRWTWGQSILDRLALADRLVEGFNAEEHEKAVRDFKAGDRTHIETTAGRIRRLCAEQSASARDRFPRQSEILQHQAGLKRRHMPVRDLVRDTADVLLALKPCWAMSPLVVSQLLPAKTYFDVVIFDEASQVTPADAMPSILRGRQLVVAGDEHQLPPTAFFVSESPEEDDDDDQALLEASPVGGTKGFEAILDVLGSLLRFRMLLWHYRSHDERLIAFSNAHIYDRQLTTFPGVGGDHVLEAVLVGHDPTADTNSPSPEVDAVVDLVLDHARNRPDESLGVIAMGIKHSNRIEETLLQRLREDDELEDELGEFFAEDKEERFFVKNLERVQGDERDAIILSIGYGKNARGDLVYRFGPLLLEGGERRLNVAVTRAKTRLALVSSFSSRDMDPERSQAAGVQLLRQYLQYVESRGENLGDTVIEKPQLNPFEVDVRDTLTRHGLKLVAQYGSSGYWIDYAVAHPTQPGRYVLAIECDGATYHSSESARDRDRLRQEQLERLGWRFHRIWSSEWFHNKDKAVANALDAYARALADCDQDDRHVTEREATTANELQRGTETLTVPERSQPRPPLRQRDSIDDYTVSDLVRLIRWIESDDLIRTQEELVAEAARELGFRRRGSKIVTAIEAAIRQARR